MSDLPIRPGEEDDALAGEYVLGVLEPAERALCEARMRFDPAFAVLVESWMAHLAPLDAAYEPLHPAPHVRAAIDRRLFGEQPAGGIWSNLWLWRGLAAASLALALLLAALPAIRPEPDTLLATLLNAETELSLVALYERDTAVLRIDHLAGSPGPDRDFELWVIAGDNPPASLGLVSATGRSEIKVPAALRPHFAAEFALAISDEPSGGSPTGRATGPVLAVAQATDI